MMTDEDYVPTPEQIDAMLAYLPEFEREGFVASELVGEPGEWPYHEYSDAAAAFQSTIYSSGFYCPFDWPSWQDNAERYVKEPESLVEADLQAIRKLFTLHLRKERFCDGHFSGMITCGHVARVLRRLEVLRRG